MYHPHCRGIQAKKRVYPSEIKIENTEQQPCVCPGTTNKDFDNRQTTLSNPKLLEAMLNVCLLKIIFYIYFFYFKISSSFF